MNNQAEYEQKKRECWKEFCKEHPLDATANGGVAFRFAFDRAYALGKQTKAITQEDVEKGAEEYAEKAMERVHSDEWDSEYVQGLIEAAWHDGYTAFGKHDASIGTINGDVVFNFT